VLYQTLIRKGLYSGVEGRAARQYERMVVASTAVMKPATDGGLAGGATRRAPRIFLNIADAEICGAGAQELDELDWLPSIS